MGWKITDQEIQALWTEIWPKIVAIAWLDDLYHEDDGNNEDPIGPSNKPSYRKCFEKSAKFRSKEVKRVADTLTEHGLLRLKWESEIPIGIAARDKGADISDISIYELVEIIDDLIDRVYPATKKSPSTTDSEEISETSDQNASNDSPGLFKWSCSEALYGKTYFYLNHKGIALPWPRTPDQRKIFVGYAQGGGALPRQAAPGESQPNGSGLNPPQDDLLKYLTSGIDWDCVESEDGSENGSKKGSTVPAKGLTGVELLTLFKKWGEEVGTAWAYHDRGVPDEIRRNIKDHIRPEVWSRWPPFLTAKAVNEQDFTIIRPPGLHSSDPSLDMEVPVPGPPDTQVPDRETIFKELIVGQATNPMYSNCY